jgi:hypothetical protein
MCKEGQAKADAPFKCCCPSSNLHGPSCPCNAQDLSSNQVIKSLQELHLHPSTMDSTTLPCQCPSAKLHGPSCPFHADAARKPYDPEWRRLSSLGEEMVLKSKLKCEHNLGPSQLG